jgi:hypothetical protein
MVRVNQVVPQDPTYGFDTLIARVSGEHVRFVLRVSPLFEGGVLTYRLCRYHLDATGGAAAGSARPCEPTASLP